MRQDSYEDLITQDLRNDPEVVEILKQLDDLYNKLFQVVMKKKYNADVSYIENDEEHLIIDGVVYDNAGFMVWLLNKETELHPEDFNDDAWPEDDEGVGKA